MSPPRIEEYLSEASDPVVVRQSGCVCQKELIAMITSQLELAFST